MEGTRLSPPLAERTEPGSIRATQAGLLIACLGAVLVVFDLLGLSILGLFLAVGGAIVAAPGGLSHRWFIGVAAGAALLVLSRLIAESAETLGGWLAVIGGVAILIGTALGYPVKGDRDTA